MAVQNRWDDWDYHIERVKSAEELTSEQKKEVIDGFEAIREIFDEGWLKEAVEKNHPLIWYLHNLAPWTRFWLLDFAKKLIELKSLQKFEEIKRGLIDPKKFGASIAELEIATKLKRAGIDVELYPKIDSKECDLKAKINDAEIFIEITVLGASEEEREASKTNELVRLLAYNFDFESSCKIYKPLSKPRREELQRKIKYTIEEVKKKGCCKEISEPGVIDCFICPKGKSDELKQLLKEKGLTRTYEGPPFSSDEIRRIRKKIQNETEQLPKNKPGIIIVFDDNLLGWARGEEDYFQIAYKLEETIYDESQLMFGIVTNRGIGHEESFREIGNWIIIRKSPYEILQESTIIIKNKYCEFPIDEKILNAFVF